VRDGLGIDSPRMGPGHRARPAKSPGEEECYSLPVRLVLLYHGWHLYFRNNLPYFRKMKKSISCQISASKSWSCQISALFSQISALLIFDFFPDFRSFFPGFRNFDIWHFRNAEIWEKSRYQKCGNMGKNAEIWQLFICGILATYRIFSICGNMGKCCGIVVFSLESGINLLSDCGLIPRTVPSPQTNKQLPGICWFLPALALPRCLQFEIDLFQGDFQSYFISIWII
jgi:hypothetical protein